MRRKAFVVLTALALVTGVGLPGTAQAAPPSYPHLDPGGPASFEERVPVNVVFVGYNRRQAPADRFREQLASSYDPVVRSRKFYGIDEPLGIHYTYDYNLRYTGTRYANKVFRKLSDLARPAPRTLYQKLYNQQESNVLRVRAVLTGPIARGHPRPAMPGRGVAGITSVTCRRSAGQPASAGAQSGQPAGPSR